MHSNKQKLTYFGSTWRALLVFSGPVASTPNRGWGRGCQLMSAAVSVLLPELCCTSSGFFPHLSSKSFTSTSWKRVADIEDCFKSWGCLLRFFRKWSSEGGGSIWVWYEIEVGCFRIFFFVLFVLVSKNVCILRQATSRLFCLKFKQLENGAYDTYVKGMLSGFCMWKSPGWMSEAILSNRKVGQEKNWFLTFDPATFFPLLCFLTCCGTFKTVECRKRYYFDLNP